MRVLSTVLCFIVFAAASVRIIRWALVAAPPWPLLVRVHSCQSVSVGWCSLQVWVEVWLQSGGCSLHKIKVPATTSRQATTWKQSRLGLQTHGSRTGSGSDSMAVLQLALFSTQSNSNSTLDVAPHTYWQVQATEALLAQRRRNSTK